MSTLLVDDVEIGGRPGLSVLVCGDRIADVGPCGEVRARAGEPDAVLAGGANALVPGLHDHHVHLFALAARAGSLWCGAPAVTCAGELGEHLRRHDGDGDGWLRAVGWDDTSAGWPDRYSLDAAVRSRPLRLQHRSGAAWVLNSAGLDRVAPDRDENWPLGAERDQRGRPTGRFFGADAWLRERIGADRPSLREVGRELAARGITGLTDATATNDADALVALATARARGELDQHIMVMTGSPARIQVPGDVLLGCVKLVISEASLPAFDDAVARIGDAHDAGRSVAVHAADRVSLVFAVTALERAGTVAGDRVEHASVAPPELVSRLAALGLTVVTQPDFVRVHGDRYLATVDAADLPWLYRGRGFLDGGVALAAGSDAPFGGAGPWPDPWLAMDTAVRRHTGAGRSIGAAEALAPEEALALFTGECDMPGKARQIAVGAAADLCLFDRTWQRARAGLADVGVRATLVGGRVVAGLQAVGV